MLKPYNDSVKLARGRRAPLLFVVFLCLQASAWAGSTKPGYLPVDPSVSLIDKQPVSVWDLSGLSVKLQPILQTWTPTITTHGFSFFSLDAAIKLGVTTVAVDASADYSVLFAESRRCEAVYAKLKVTLNDSTTKEVNATALIGCACRVDVLTKAGSLSAALGIGSASIDIKIKAISETLSFNALGFTNYKPFHVTIDNTGTIDLGAIRHDMIEVFNAYSDAAGTTSNIAPLLLGFEVGQDFPEMKLVKKIEVTDLSR